MRKILVILSLLVVLVGVGAAGYWYWLSGQPSIEVGGQPTPGLPSADQVQDTPDSTVATTTTQVVGPASSNARLVKVSKGPVVPGLLLMNVPAQSASSSPEAALYYLERTSGNIFRYLTKTRTITRTSNRTVPGIYEARWLPSAARVFVRYLSGDDTMTVNTYALPTDGSSGFFLPQNLSDIAVSSTTILTLSSGINGSIASTRGSGGGAAQTIFSTPLASLRIAFAGNARYLAFTKPSATLPGYVFLAETGRLTRIIGPLNGLAALPSPSGKWLLVSYVQGGELAAQLVNTVTREVLPLPIGTITDKCVWAVDDSVLYCGVPVSPSANYTYPDGWYQGAVSFSDRIWKINVSGRYATLVLDFNKEARIPLDIHAIAIDPRVTTLSFVNKIDGALWVYEL